jgi:hypothetical protein
MYEKQFEAIKKEIATLGLINEEPVRVNAWTVVTSPKMFFKYNLAVCDTYKGYIRKNAILHLRSIIFAIRTNHCEHYDLLNMERDDKIKAVNQLLYNHRRVISFDDEYTPAKYDFLVDEGKLVLTAEQKKTIFAKAIGEYKYELENMVLNEGGLYSAKYANAILDNLPDRKFTRKQLEYLQNKSKVIALKEYFDSLETDFTKFDNYDNKEQKSAKDRK